MIYRQRHSSIFNKDIGPIEPIKPQNSCHTATKIMSNDDKSMKKSSSAIHIGVKQKLKVSNSSHLLDRSLQNKSRLFRSNFCAESNPEKKDWLRYAKVSTLIHHSYRKKKFISLS